MIVQGHHTPPGSPMPTKPPAHQPSHHNKVGKPRPTSKPSKPAAPSKPSAHKPASHKPSPSKKTAPRWEIETEENELYPLPGLKQSGHIEVIQ